MIRERVTGCLLILFISILVLVGAGRSGGSSLKKRPALPLPTSAHKDTSGALAAGTKPFQLTVRTRGGDAVKKGVWTSQRVPLYFPILAAFLYNLSIGFTIPVMPKIVNTLVNQGDSKVSPKSASIYGAITSMDQVMTFLLVNAACTLSDKHGRRPFMALANLGLGTGQIIAAFAERPEFLLLGAFIDGCTSYSFPLAQAYIADVTPPEKLPEAYGAFQGLAAGAAFLVGIPVGGILASKRGLKVPLYVAASTCLLNILYITLLLPESLDKTRRNSNTALADANAIGALKMIARNPFITLTGLTYFFLNLALNGLQINFINYTQYRYGWGLPQSSGALCVVFLLVGIFPKLLIPVMGLRNAIQYGSLIYSAAFAFLASCSAGWLVIPGLALLAMGSICLPATLALLINQVQADEKGAMNGAADTLRTASTTLGFPLMTGVFAFFISEKAPLKLPGAALYLSSILVLLGSMSLSAAIRFHEHHELVEWK